MGTYNESTLDSILAGEAVPQGSLVLQHTDNTGKLTGVSTVYDVIGVAMEPGVLGQPMRIQSLRGSTRAVVLTDTSTINIGTKVYKGATGFVSAASTGSVLVGIAAEANGGVAALITIRPIG